MYLNGDVEVKMNNLKYEKYKKKNAKHDAPSPLKLLRVAVVTTKLACNNKSGSDGSWRIWG